MEWLKVSRKSEMRCELCGEQFSFRRVYAPDAPTHLSSSEFLLALIPIIISALMKMFRVIFLTICLLILLPLATMWWMNVCFRYLASGAWTWEIVNMTFSDFFYLWWGGVISAAVLCFLPALFAFVLHPIIISVISRLINFISSLTLLGLRSRTSQSKYQG
jgi:E3 ubiquitin-protein ligase DOA10